MPGSKLSEQEKDAVLTEAARNALNDISGRELQGMPPLQAREIIRLGLAMYWNDPRVKAVFGPERAVRQTRRKSPGTKEV